MSNTMSDYLSKGGKTQDQEKDKNNQNQNTQNSTFPSGAGTGAQPTQPAQNKSQQSQQQKPKSSGSGMFTNIRKYIDRNKQGAQNMSGQVQSNVAQQNQNIQQAINKQQTDFRSRVEQNRALVEGAKKFGQEAITAAQGQTSMPWLQSQQRSLQERYDAIQNVDNQYVRDYQKYLEGFQAPEQGQQEPMAFDTYARENIYLPEQEMQRGADLTQRIADLSRPTGWNSRDRRNRQEVARLKSQNKDLLSRYNAVAPTYREASRQYNEQLRLDSNRQNLKAELDAITDKIENAPEELTEADVERFNRLRTGKTRFDDVSMNLTREQEKAKQLEDKLGLLKSSQGRRNLLRNQFGSLGGYTGGQASLDNLVLSSNKEAVNQLKDFTKQQAELAQQSLNEAYEEGRMGIDELRRKTEALQKDLNTKLENAETQLLKGDQGYQDLNDELQKQLEIVNTGGTLEEREEAQARVKELKDEIAAYEGDLGLEGRAATGEGTFVKTIKDKLAEGKGLTKEELDMLGIGEDAYYVSDPQDLLRDIEIDPETFSIQDVATAEDVARASALARLAGGTPEDYLQNKLGLEEEELNRIAKKGIYGEDEKFATSFDELSQSEKDLLKDTRDTVAAQRKTISSNLKRIKELDGAAKHSRWERDRWRSVGGSDQHQLNHWNYWNNIYVLQQQERNKLSKEINDIKKQGDFKLTEFE